MDELDFRILREVLAGDTDSFRSDRARVDDIARRLGVHRNTVSARIKRLSDAHVFLPLTLEIDPGRFGMVGARVFLDVPRDRRTPETREALFHLEGVFGILAYHDGWELVLYGEDESSLESKVEAARALTWARTASWELHTGRDYPPDEPVRLSRIDARLIAGLLRNARVSFAALAKQLGVTRRTIERRYNRLREMKLISMLPGSGADIQGMAMATLSAQVPEEPRARARTIERILATLPNHYIRNVATRDKVHLFLYGPSLADIESQLVELRTVPGVGKVTFRIFLGPFPNPRYRDWLARVVERGVAT